MKNSVEESTLPPRLFVTLSYRNDKFQHDKIFSDAVAFQYKLSKAAKGAHIQLWSAYGCEFSKGVILSARKHITAVISADKDITPEMVEKCWGWGNVETEAYVYGSNMVMYTYDHHHPLGLAQHCPRRNGSCKRRRCKHGSYRSNKHLTLLHNMNGI